MKPTKRLIELDERNMEICKEVLAIAESIMPPSNFGKTPSKKMQQNLGDLFEWLDATLEWATLHEREWMKELDAKLNAKNDLYFSDYELRIKQCGQKCYNNEFEILFEKIVNYKPSTWNDHGLVFPEDILSPDQYNDHLDWRRNEKKSLLSSAISHFDRVTTSFEITHQYIVQLRAGKWHKVSYDAKRFGKNGKAMRMKDDENLPW